MGYYTPKTIIEIFKLLIDEDTENIFYRIDYLSQNKNPDDRDVVPLEYVIDDMGNDENMTKEKILPILKKLTDAMLISGHHFEYNMDGGVTTAYKLTKLGENVLKMIKDLHRGLLQ